MMQTRCDSCSLWSPYHSADCVEGKFEEWVNSLSDEEWELQLELYWDHIDQFGPAADSRLEFFGFANKTVDHE